MGWDLTMEEKKKLLYETTMTGIVKFCEQQWAMSRCDDDVVTEKTKPKETPLWLTEGKVTIRYDVMW